MRRVLMVAFHFPPLSVSSGIQRTLRFVQHLPEFGWEPIVLTAHPRAYSVTSNDLVKEIPAGTVVERAFALDTSKHLALLRRYPAFLARPDRWVSWWLGGVTAGRRLIDRYRPDAIWSTYPIATAHLIGRSLHRSSGLPWIADFRDPMAQDGYPADPKTRRWFTKIEANAMREARHCVFVTPGAARMYRERYPEAPVERVQIIENGYDEQTFAVAERKATEGGPLNPGAVTLLHSGTVYPSERDPTQLFEAVRRLNDAKLINPAQLRLRFRATGHDAMVLERATNAGVADYLELLPSVPYNEALAEMIRADAVLVLQSKGCNEQVPAKLYEYFRARRPILALADPAGDTARTIREYGLDSIAPLESVDGIARLLPSFIERIRAHASALPDPIKVRLASRSGRTSALVQLLEQP